MRTVNGSPSSTPDQNAPSVLNAVRYAEDRVLGGTITEPFLKWAGSKRSHLTQLRRVVPTSYNTYFEPFLGSGALFFSLEPALAVLSDKLAPLIRTFQAVKKSPDEVFAKYGEWPVEREHYYKIRAEIFSDDISAAAQFIYLNKTAFNGLHRVNQRGVFNVPFGLPKSTTIVPIEKLQSASRALSKAELHNVDFETALSTAGKNDLVFVDPPYVTTHNDNGFIHYNESLFRWDDQVRLARRCVELKDKGAHVIITNAAHSSIIDLYRGFHVTEFNRSSTLAGKAEKRGKVKELIFSTMRPTNE